MGYKISYLTATYYKKNIIYISRIQMIYLKLFLEKLLDTIILNTNLNRINSFIK